jgi:hypothetical protein
VSIHAVDARVKTATLTGIVQQDTGTWPAYTFDAVCDQDQIWYSDNTPASPGTPALSLPTDIAAMTFTCRRAGSPILGDPCGGDFVAKFMNGVGAPGVFTGGMRDGERAIYNLATTGGSDKADIRFANAVIGVGCFVQSNANANFFARIKAFAAGDVLLHSVIWASFSVNSYANPPFERVPFLAIARDAGDTADIVRVEIECRVHTAPQGPPITPPVKDPISDATFEAQPEADFLWGQLIFGPFDPLVVLTPAFIPSSSEVTCGPALFTQQCVIDCLPDVLPRATLVPTTAPLVSGIATSTLAECGHPLMVNPCALEECEA